jgi:2-dehydro-3-deoxyglucarate aldolase
MAVLIVLLTLTQMSPSVNQNHGESSTNGFRRSLITQQPLIGCWTSLANHVTTEILGYAGFDWLLIDGEHAPNDIATFVTQLLALKGSPTAAVVRPQCSEPIIIKRLLDIGFRDFLLPMVDSADQARNLVAATRYPPEGFRGIGTAHRANHYGLTKDYFEHANENVSVMVQIESVTAMKNVESIAAVEGVDGLFVGPSDLSAALGCRTPGAPEVQRAIARVIECGRAAGKATGILAPVEEDARRYLELGMSAVAVGGDVALLRNASVDLRRRFKP